MAMKKGWFDRVVLRKARDAGMDQEDLDKMRDEAMHELPAEAFESSGGEGGDQHVHVHLHNGETHDDEDPAATGADPNARDPAQADPAVAELASRVDALEAMLQELMDGESDVELEDQDTKDARRFKMRRGKSLTRDESEAPKREPDMIGETDLPGTEDLNKKTADSASMEALWATALANAEIIAPGYRMPTFDARHHPTLTAKRMCALRRGCLAEATKDEAVRATVHRFTDGAPIGRMPCDVLKIAFNATADALKIVRNGSVLRSSHATTMDNRRRNADGTLAPVGPPSNQEFNQRAKEFWNSGAGNGSIRH